MLNILYIAGGNFPNGSAYSSRVRAFADLLTNLNYKVHIFADYESGSEDKNNKGYGRYNNATYQTIIDEISLKERILLPYKNKQKVIEYLEKDKVDLVIIRSLSDRFSLLYKEIKKRKIPIILESCEWYHHSNWRFGRLNPWYIQFRHSWDRVFPKADGVIAISTFLSEHYANYMDKKKIIRIPTIMDADTIDYSLNTVNKKIKLMYAGNPGNSKELLSNILKSLDLLGKESERYIFDIYGVDYEQLLRHLGREAYLMDRLDKIVNVNGKIDQEDILKKYQESDFGIFIRPNRRSSHAGFPTKLAECMLAGTPMICNDTGDIGKYLNKDNGYLLNTDSPEELKDTLLVVADMSSEDRLRMRRKAREDGVSYFDYKNYLHEISAFINMFIRK